MRKAENLRKILEEVNTKYGTKYSLVNMGGKKYGIYNGDWNKPGMWLRTGNLDYLLGFIDGLYLND